MSEAVTTPVEFAIVSRLKQACAKCCCLVAPEQPYRLRENAVHCARCSGWDELIIVPSGDPALTRRVSKLSAIALPVCEWNKRRKRWERRGTLATPDALAEAHALCAMDAEKRERSREKAQARQAIKDKEYIQHFAAEVRMRYGHIPEGAELQIAQHACEKYSGRVGRTAAAKELDPEMVTLAVIAHIRHAYTNYDSLLLSGVPKEAARQRIRSKVQQILASWHLPLTSTDESLEA